MEEQGGGHWLLLADISLTLAGGGCRPNVLAPSRRPPAPRRSPDLHQAKVLTGCIGSPARRALPVGQNAAVGIKPDVPVLSF